jgi:hypothetical protein
MKANAFLIGSLLWARSLRVPHDRLSDLIGFLSSAKRPARTGVIGGEDRRCGWRLGLQASGLSRVFAGPDCPKATQPVA